MIFLHFLQEILCPGLASTIKRGHDIGCRASEAHAAVAKIPQQCSIVVDMLVSCVQPAKNDLQKHDHIVHLVLCAGGVLCWVANFYEKSSSACTTRWDPGPQSVDRKLDIADAKPDILFS